MAIAREVDLRIDQQLPEIVTESAQLELVLMNLFSNAIKYCDLQKTTRYVEVVGVPSMTPGECTICVRDNGIGIPEEKLPHVFSRFFRAHRDRDEELGTDGSGLGLSITEEAVRILGGSIRVESKEGEGTSVFVTLPDAGAMDDPVPPPDTV
jgi:signal transduction histidine kinase